MDSFSKSFNRFLQGLIWLGLGLIILTPLLISSKFYFPFIYTKSLVFKIAVEIIFIAYLILAARLHQYRLKINLFILLFTTFVLSAFVSSFFGINFYRSFWSNMERQEGLFLLLHLLMFLVVLTNFIRSKKEWFYLLDVSVFVGLLISLYALAQYFGFEWDFLIKEESTRLSATIGNASYLAGYLIFNILFAGYLFLNRFRYIWARVYYPFTMILGIFILLQTGTRGGFIALAVAVLVMLGYLIFKGSYKIKKASAVGLIIFIILSGLLFVFKDSVVVKNVPALQRVTNISLSHRTIQTRFWTWQAAWQGFKERPVLGYGYENFNVVFNKYFNPKFYEDEGSRVWFDRAHNVIFDRLITGGIIGLIIYLVFLFYPLYRIFRSKNDDDEEEEEEDENSFIKSFGKLILILVVIAYFIQNLFVFDHLITLVPLFLTLPFIIYLTGDKWYLKDFSHGQKLAGVLFAVSLIFLGPMFYYGIVKPTQANQDTILAMTFEELGAYDQVVGYYEKAIDYNTYGNQEFRILWANFVINYISDKEHVLFWQEVVKKVDQELATQITEQPENVINYLLRMRFNYTSRIIDPLLLSKNYDLFEEAFRLSPSRPHIYYEMGYTQLANGARFQEKGDESLSQGFYKGAINNFEKALSLAPHALEAHVTYIMALINVGRPDLVIEYLSQLDEQGIDYRQEIELVKMANSALYFEQYELVKLFYAELVNIVPDNFNYWINLALANAYLGEDEEAIAIAERIKEVNVSYQATADEFIQKVRQGDFK